MTDGVSNAALPGPVCVHVCAPRARVFVLSPPPTVTRSKKEHAIMDVMRTRQSVQPAGDKCRHNLMNDVDASVRSLSIRTEHLHLPSNEHAF